MKYYLATKGNVALIPAITRVNLENIILREINHSKKTKDYITPFDEMSRIGKWVSLET